jgi:hypothetical protein
MIRHKLVSGQAGTRFVSEQGTKMGRRSLLHVEVQAEDDGIYTGGQVTPVAEAVMTLESFEGMRVAAIVSGHPKDQTKRCVLLGAGRRVKASNAVKNRYGRRSGNERRISGK